VTGERAACRAADTGAHDAQLPDRARAALPANRGLPQQHTRR